MCPRPGVLPGGWPHTCTCTEQGALRPFRHRVPFTLPSSLCRCCLDTRRGHRRGPGQQRPLCAEVGVRTSPWSTGQSQVQAGRGDGGQESGAGEGAGGA